LTDHATDRDDAALGGVDRAEAAAEMSQRPPRHNGSEAPQIRRFAVECAKLLSDLHCEDVLVLDVRGLCEITDYILIASGTSDRQIKSVSDDLEDLAEEHGFARFGRDSDAATTWMVVDFVDVVAHLFEPMTRAHYDLEMMWGDAPIVHWRNAEQG